MSGLEIAGVVLGAFPLVVEGARAMRPLIEMSRFWWKFRDAFPAMVGAIEDQMIAYGQNIKIILKPLDLDGATESSLLNDRPPSRMWHDADIQALLRRRIGHDHFTWLLGHIRRIDQVMAQLTTLLYIKNGEICLPKPGTFSASIARAALSFTGKRQLVDEVADINTKIHEFLKRDLLVAQATVLSSAIMLKGAKEAHAKQSAPFLALQANVATICRVLHPSRWECTCGGRHGCAIAIDWRFNKLRRRVGSPRLVVGPPGRAKAAKVTVSSHGAEDAARNREEGMVGLDQVSRLTRQLGFENRSEARIRAGKEGSASILALAATQTVLGPAGESAEASWLPRVSSKLARRSQSGNILKSQTSGDVGQSQTEIIEATTRETSVRSVRFEPAPNPDPSHSLEKDPTPWPMDVSCAFIERTFAPQGCGYLTDDKTVVSFDFDAAEVAAPEVASPAPLEEFYTSTPHIGKRILLAVKLAYTMLGVGTSPWLPNSWKSENVSVLPEAPAVPLFNHGCIRTALLRRIASATLHTEAAVFSLGVTLLELMFQEKLEAQPFFGDHCVDGRANGTTVELAAREWQRMVEAEYGPDIADVVMRCVAVRFSVTPDFGKAEFVHEMLKAVIEPLEDFARHFQY